MSLHGEVKVERSNDWRLPYHPSLRGARVKASVFQKTKWYQEGCITFLLTSAEQVNCHSSDGVKGEHEGEVTAGQSCTDAQPMKLSVTTGIVDSLSLLWFYTVTSLKS